MIIVIISLIQTVLFLLFTYLKPSIEGHLRENNIISTLVLIHSQSFVVFFLLFLKSQPIYKEVIHPGLHTIHKQT